MNREDEGVYEVSVRDSKSGVEKKRFNYVLVVLDKCENDISDVLDTADRDCATPYLANRLRGNTPWGTPRITPRATPRCSPFASPLSTPRMTPTRSMTPQFGDESDSSVRSSPMRSSSSTSSSINPKILSGLSDLTTTPGGCGELKCYLLTIPGLETRWEKDGVPIDSGDGRIIFSSRGVRGLTLRNLREEDSGTYSVRVTGPGTNLYSSARVTITSKRAINKCPN